MNTRRAKDRRPRDHYGCDVQSGLGTSNVTGAGDPDKNSSSGGAASCPISCGHFQRVQNGEQNHQGHPDTPQGALGARPEAASRHTRGDHVHTRGYRTGEHMCPQLHHMSRQCRHPQLCHPFLTPHGRPVSPRAWPRVPTPGSLVLPGGSSTESRGSQRGPRLSSPVRGMGTGQTEPSRGDMRTAAPKAPGCPDTGRKRASRTHVPVRLQRRTRDNSRQGAPRRQQSSKGCQTLRPVRPCTWVSKAEQRLLGRQEPPAAPPLLCVSARPLPQIARGRPERARAGPYLDCSSS